VTPLKPLPAVPSLREAEAGANTSTVEVDQQLLGKSAGANSLSGDPHPDDPLPEARLDVSVGE